MATSMIKRVWTDLRAYARQTDLSYEWYCHKAEWNGRFPDHERGGWQDTPYYSGSSGDSHPGPLVVGLAFAIWKIKKVIGVVRCAVAGDHLYEDHSYCGPDSGYEAMTCTRCGHSWSHTYY